MTGCQNTVLDQDAKSREPKLGSFALASVLVAKLGRPRLSLPLVGGQAFTCS